MAGGEDGSILKRKASAGRDKGPSGRRPDTSKALALAFSRATDAQLDLPSRVAQCSEHLCSLAELLERLPDSGLFALLEGPAEAQGLMVLDPDFLGTIIEKQMTGKLGKEPPAPRRVTRTDAALSADLIDATLGLFEAEFALRPEARWAAGFGYASYLEEPRPLGLILEDTDYRLFSFTVDLGIGTTRQVSGMLAFLADGRGPIYADPDIPVANVAEVTPEGWRETLEDSVAEGEVQLQALLHRFRLSIAEVSRLQPGQTLEIPTRAIDRTELTALDGSRVASGRLGSSGGKRALRLSVIGPALEDSSGSFPGHKETAKTALTTDRSRPRADMEGTGTMEPKGDAYASEPALEHQLQETAPTLQSRPELEDAIPPSGMPATEPMAELPDLT